MLQCNVTELMMLMMMMMQKEWLTKTDDILLHSSVGQCHGPVRTVAGFPMRNTEDFSSLALTLSVPSPLLFTLA